MPDRQSRLFLPSLYVFFFFFNDTATTEIYTLSLHDALPIYTLGHPVGDALLCCVADRLRACVDRKSTRLNSSHGSISYAVFCLKKKKKKQKRRYGDLIVSTISNKVTELVHEFVAIFHS